MKTCLRRCSCPHHRSDLDAKRRTVNGILWVLRTGAPWRDMSARYGNWNSVFVRFTRWSKLGVWDAAFETLASLGPPADKEHAIDSTIVRAHQHAAGVKGGIKIRKRSAARAAASRLKSISARTPRALVGSSFRRTPDPSRKRQSR
jgi:putative transposase